MEHDIVIQMIALLREHYATEDSIGLMLDRLAEAGIEVSNRLCRGEISYNEHVREVYKTWARTDSKSVLSAAFSVVAKEL